nr:C39 family peptidase [Oscillospiraceae bacterium]
MKTKKLLIAALTVLAVLLIALLGAKPIYNLYRDLSFGWEERSPEEHIVKAYAETMGISYGEYPIALIELFERNPETEGFVLNYPFRADMDVDLTDFDRDTVPLFLQWDPMWGYEDYGSDCIAITGCGPTCLAMAGWYLTGDDNMNPEKIAKFAQRGGYYETGYGSSWTLISQGGAELGLDVTELPLVEKKINSALEAGSPVILALGPGDFTSTGHYIVLASLEEGGYRVNDPNSRVNSQRLWSYEELEGQIRNIWAIAKP